MYVFTSRPRSSMLRILGALMLALALLGTAFSNVTAQSGEKPGPLPGYEPQPSQIISGNPIKVTVLDNTQIGIQFTNPALGQNSTPQFYADFANGVYLWVPIDGATKVFGPAYVPGGHFANAYLPVSNTISGTGTPANPWVVTTVNDVPGTKIRLTQTTSYVNGAEYVKLQYALQQMGGVAPIKVAILHAADLSAGKDSELAFGYYNDHTHGVGDYVYGGTMPAIRYYQQFVPMVAPSAHQEGDYAEIWDQIGDISGAGPGFNDICKVDEALDAAVGMQWNLTVPAAGTVTVGNVAFFGPHIDLAGSFSDVAYGSYPYEYIYTLGTQHIISGYADGTFRPNNDATRAQLAKMVVLAMGWELTQPNDVAHFKDVPRSDPFFAYIETAYSHGVIGGYEDGTFRPMNDVTRGQAMKMVVNAAGWRIDVAGGPHFRDVPIDSTYYRYIETALKAGVIGGYADGTFRPMNDMTRAQLSKVLYPLVTEFGNSK